MSKNYETGEGLTRKELLDGIRAKLSEAWCEPHNRWERDCPRCGTTDVSSDHTCEEA